MRAFEQFTELLLANGVTLLLDVRRCPHFRRHPHFDEEALLERLHDARGVGYLHLPGLGGRRRTRPESPNAYLAQPLLARLRRPHTNTRVPGRLRKATRDVREGTGMLDMLGGGVVALPSKDDRRRFGSARHRRGDLLGETRRQAHMLTPWAHVTSRTELLYPSEG
jgi:hypothetical protein